MFNKAELKIIIQILVCLMTAITVSGQLAENWILEETGVYTIADSITGFCSENLDQAGSREMIFCTADHVYIYEHPSQNLLWSSPVLDHPRELKFGDFNNDGLLDMAVEDIIHIYLFDPLNEQTIWTSPPLDSTFKCYAEGDENDDGWLDLVIVSKEPFTRPGDPDNRDTVWVDIFYGPSFQSQNGFFVLMPNYSYSTSSSFLYSENPRSVIIKAFSGSGGLQTRIVIFSSSYYRQLEPGDYGYIWYAGTARLVDPGNYSVTYLGGVYDVIAGRSVSLDNSVRFNMLSEAYYISLSSWLIEHTLCKFIISISADSILSTATIWSDSRIDFAFDRTFDWSGYDIGEFIGNDESAEICFADWGNVYLAGFEDGGSIWAAPSNIILDTLCLRYEDQTAFDRPKIICGSGDEAVAYVIFDNSGDTEILIPEQGIILNDAIDLEADGNDDLISINGNRLAIYGLVEIAIDYPRFMEMVITDDFSGAFSASGGDINGDGLMDILAAGEILDDDGRIAWWENLDSCRFVEHLISENFGTPSSVSAVDLDGDFDNDVLASARTNENLCWWENHGGGYFNRHVITSNFASAADVVAADLDNDDDMDLVACASATNKILWLENDGSQSFFGHVIDLMAGGVNSVEVIDLDGDGDVDILGAMSGSDRVSWYENEGSGVFTEQIIAGSIDGAYWVQAADLDGDGDMDVLAAAYGSGRLYWWENDGQQQFDQHLLAEGHNGAYATIAADLDNDADLDVIGSINYDGDIFWWENDGAGNFIRHVIALDFYGATSIFATDADNDGDSDILAVAHNLDKISFWLNDHFPPVFIQEDGSKNNLPLNCVLFQNYPNPFNQTTVIRFDLPDAAMAKIEIFDILGRRVETLIDQVQPAGSHQITWNPEALASGVYFYRLQAGNQSDIRRMMLIK